MHARPDGSLPPSPRWLNDDPYSSLGERRSFGAASGLGSIGVAKRWWSGSTSSMPSSPRGCTSGAPCSTKPRRSTTRSGRPSKPDGDGGHLVLAGRPWHRRWCGPEPSEARRCARSAARCCTAMASWPSSSCTRSSTSTATRSSAGRRSRPWPTASGTRRSKGGRSGSGAASTGPRGSAPPHIDPRPGRRPGELVPCLRELAARRAVLRRRCRRACG